MAVIGGNLAFGMGDGELTNQHSAWEIWQKLLWEILWEMLLGNLAGDSVEQGAGDKACLRKAVIGEIYH